MVVAPQRLAFSFKSLSWPNQIWSGGDGWLHFRETTPLRDPGSPRITNGFLIIFHHPILCLSLISPMIPETSRELHLNLCDQSWLRSSLSRTCLTAPNTLCVHKAYARRNSRCSGAHRCLTLSPHERPRSTATHTHAVSLPQLPLRTFTPQTVKNKEKVSHHLQLFTGHSCVTSVCRWRSLSSFESWWASPTITRLPFANLAALGFYSTCSFLVVYIYSWWKEPVAFITLISK